MVDGLVVRELRYIRELLEKIALRNGIDVMGLCGQYYGQWLGDEQTCLLPHEEIIKLDEEGDE